MKNKSTTKLSGSYTCISTLNSDMPHSALHEQQDTQHLWRGPVKLQALPISPEALKPLRPVRTLLLNSGDPNQAKKKKGGEQA